MADKIFNTNLDIRGDVKANSYKFNLPSSLPGQVNTLIPKIDGTRPIWYDNSSVGNDLAFKSDVDNIQIGGRNLLLNSKVPSKIILDKSPSKFVDVLAIDKCCKPFATNKSCVLTPPLFT